MVAPMSGMEPATGLVASPGIEFATEGDGARIAFSTDEPTPCTARRAADAPRSTGPIGNGARAFAAAAPWRPAAS